MTVRTVLGFAAQAVIAHRLRSALTMLGIIIGIASVTLLTSVGQGTRDYVMTEFTQFGTNLLQINPGRTTTGGMPAGIGATIRKLTLDDADSLRRVPGVELVVPVAFGRARVEAGPLARSVYVYGVTSDLPALWRFGVSQGQFLAPGDARRGGAVAVLGPKLKQEIFGGANALGSRVRIGGRRFQVVGVMASKGQLLGFDIDDAAYIPVAAAQELFNQDGLVEIDVTFSRAADSDAIAAAVTRMIASRHDNTVDFTVTTQTEMLATVDRILGIVSWAVSGIGAISLVVGAIGVLTIMWISVGERTSEVGLLKALGAERRDILSIFLGEAMLLAAAGGVIGIAGGLGLAWLISTLFPGVPFSLSVPYLFAAIATSITVGVLSGVLPARRASALDPIEALRAE